MRNPAWTEVAEVGECNVARPGAAACGASVIEHAARQMPGVGPPLAYGERAATVRRARRLPRPAPYLVLGLVLVVLLGAQTAEPPVVDGLLGAPGDGRDLPPRPARPAGGAHQGGLPVAELHAVHVRPGRGRSGYRPGVDHRAPDGRHRQPRPVPRGVRAVRVGADRPAPGRVLGAPRHAGLLGLRSVAVERPAQPQLDRVRLAVSLDVRDGRRVRSSAGPCCATTTRCRRLARGRRRRACGRGACRIRSPGVVDRDAARARRHPSAPLPAGPGRSAGGRPAVVGSASCSSGRTTRSSACIRRGDELLPACRCAVSRGLPAADRRGPARVLRGRAPLPAGSAPTRSRSCSSVPEPSTCTARSSTNATSAGSCRSSCSACAHRHRDPRRRLVRAPGAAARRCSSGGSRSRPRSVSSVSSRASCERRSLPRSSRVAARPDGVATDHAPYDGLERALRLGYDRRRGRQSPLASSRRRTALGGRVARLDRRRSSTTSLERRSRRAQFLESDDDRRRRRASDDRDALRRRGRACARPRTCGRVHGARVRRTVICAQGPAWKLVRACLTRRSPASGSTSTSRACQASESSSASGFGRQVPKEWSNVSMCGATLCTVACSPVTATRKASRPIASSSSPRSR